MHKSGSELNVYYRNKHLGTLKEFLQEYSPTVWFVDGLSMEGNILVKSQKDYSAAFPESKKIVWIGKILILLLNRNVLSNYS